MSLNRILTRKRLGLLLGPFFFALIFWQVIPTEGLSETGRAVLASTLWIATWWMSEAIPISATSLLPIVILPITGGAPINQTTAAYGDKMLFLFVGGFIIAIAMQKWNLHKRIALSIIHAIGGKAHTLILGFMLATGFLSMWISNTATTLMMVTIAIALISQTKEYLNESGSAFFKALLLSIAFSSSIGGVATLIGTPTNPIFVAIAQELYGVDISFIDWMIFALPFSIFMLVVTWLVLTRWVFKVHRLELPVGQEMIKQELKKMGKMSFEEKTIAWVFGLVALAWITRSFLLDPLIPGINDTTIAIAGALLLFIWPSSRPGQHILTWDEAERLPWGIIILFGGGLSLAAAFESSGLAQWLGMQLSNANNLPLFALIVLVTLSVNFLTEVTSNVATASIALPILAALASAIGVNPYLLMVPATMAASCAFMLPVATAPNAIVFGSGHLEIQDMVKSGIWLNLISTLLIAILVYFLVPIVL
jgi:sodium-dependent dicarboxylate transporter 2/3/5